MKKYLIQNEHVVLWCQNHVVENWRTHTFYKYGALPGMGLDDYMQKVFPGTGTSQEHADYFGWLAYMANLALKAEKEAQELGQHCYYTQAITNPRQTQKKRLEIE